MIIKYGQITYPDIINEHAINYGHEISKLRYKLVQDNKAFDREELNLACNINGVKAELVFRHMLDMKGIVYETGEILSAQVQKKPDFIIGRTGFDVKYVGNNAGDLRVNSYAHQNRAKKNISFYVFVKIKENNQAEYWVINAKDVSTWKKVKLINSEAYVFPITDLKKHTIIETHMNYNVNI